MVEIFGDDYPTPDGTCIRDYIHVDDLISAHLLALNALMCDGGTMVFNCGYGRGYSVLNVLDTVDRVIGRPLKRLSAARRAGDPPILVANADTIRTRLGWDPMARLAGGNCRVRHLLGAIPAVIVPFS